MGGKFLPNGRNCMGGWGGDAKIIPLGEIEWFCLEIFFSTLKQFKFIFFSGNFFPRNYLGFSLNLG